MGNIMSRLMLHGVLKMPPDLWSSEPLDTNQRYAQYVYASEVIEGLDAHVAELTRQREVLQKLLANYATNTGAGANDPDVLEALLFGCDKPWED